MFSIRKNWSTPCQIDVEVNISGTQGHQATKNLTLAFALASERWHPHPLVMPLGAIIWCQVSNRDRSSNMGNELTQKQCSKSLLWKQKYSKVFKLWGFSPLEKYYIVTIGYNWIMFPSIGRHKQCWKSPSSAGLALCHRSQRCKVPNGHLGGFKGASRTGDAQLRSYYGITCVDSAAVIIVIVIIIIIIIILVSIASTSCNLIFRLPSFKQNHRLLANLEIAVHSMHVASDFYMATLHTYITYIYLHTTHALQGHICAKQMGGI